MSRGWVCLEDGYVQDVWGWEVGTHHPRLASRRYAFYWNALLYLLHIYLLENS